ncbi:uncharacterized protein BO80DRAFT_143151 [Aspergillus ibericus CBS 121593]|uniref:Argonaute complex, subunit Arb1 n=1 Tax=Aspergillus ibericus CBS 121593 TaxID=1448316 RepID=A0A395GTY3_9EURO|nr:hypothetical protein BO80DRAFT_143151 [Aspergillus ibericus CBS 121593]RAK99031.1 hypothetical protein BO80DRAFT_143151 [Aspergillus ibericus CBS 121593]
MQDSTDTINTINDLPLRPAKPEDATDAQQSEQGKPGSATPQSPEEQQAQDPVMPVELGEPKKKKRSKPRPKSKRGKNKPTGFEEYYVDAPITPQEFENERQIYDVSRPLLFRLEDALLRYQKNRRLESDRRVVFLKYLAYGGVDIGQKMFGGVDGRDLQAMDSEQILQARALASIKKDKSNLAVDFDAVVRGFLTSFFPYYFNPETEDMVKLATVTIRNFLSYLLYHDVCPEYNENIDQARTSCDIAAKELWKNQQFMAKGPGDFNTACSMLFGGDLYNACAFGHDWKPSKDDSPGMTNEAARKIVKFALACAGEDAQTLRYLEVDKQNQLGARRIEDIDGFEITAVHPPDQVVCSLYDAQAPDLNAVGKLLAKAYRDPGQPPYDRSPEEDMIGFPELEFEFFLEGSLLQYCYPGMKVITPVWEMSCGFYYFEDVNRAYCSTYTVLDNDLMLGWKKPSDLTGSQDDTNDDGDDSSVTL